ncbi:hypothetical protein KUTeg_022299 [Tegillarca granosa]|uniref:Uncharacterized protein n=1 Tax=Tegillarca granosa TaxID=220873 RepID=A0ABQ9EBE6_TEGGR|nr:hypothetical protein KUTeg_022299 [Tegillarca granosa]
MSDLCEKHFVSQKKHVFPGVFTKEAKLFFEDLEEFDIVVHQKERFCPLFLTFDMEAILKSVSSMNISNVDCERIHLAISVSICSNVHNFSSEYFISNQNLDELLLKMVNHMHKISEETFTLSCVKWKYVFDK